VGGELTNIEKQKMRQSVRQSVEDKMDRRQAVLAAETADKDAPWFQLLYQK
jgi:hypothetical protein